MDGSSPQDDRGISPDLFAEASRVRVLFPVPALGPLDYAAPAGLDLKPGDHVEAPLGARTLRGVVWPGACERRESLKIVLNRCDAPPLGADLMDFLDFVARYTMSPPGAVLTMALRAPAIFDGAPSRTLHRAVDPPPEDLRWTDARRRLFAAALEEGGDTLSGLARRAGVGPGVAKGLAEAGALEPYDAPRDAPFDPLDPARAGPRLRAEQEAAAARLRHAVGAGEGGVFLLDGVTGSGKTEVYFEAAAAALRSSPTAQVLILLPEIALTRDILRRAEARFGSPPAEWHSDLSQTERRRVWRGVAEGRARIVIGARSALFLPFRDLALIVVDEEHDASYKQEDGVRYQARDMAVARGHRLGRPVILASATPSLESWANGEAGRYERLALKARHGSARLPTIRIVDLKRHPPAKDRWISEPVRAGVAAALARGEQALLFLNRRGYAPAMICRACGEPLRAPDSDTLLVYHRFAHEVRCHHTGYAAPPPEACPSCGAEGSFAPCGPGVERLADEVAETFPDARLAVASSDAFQDAGRARALLSAMREGAVDVIVGTQVLAKGHHFPNLTVTAVIDADLGLRGGDLRAGERTYQLLTQAAGRAGRADRPGEAFIQTYDAQGAVIRAIAAGDRDAFLTREAEGRRLLGFPPFGRLIALVLSGEDARAVEEAARALAAHAPNMDRVEVWGPAPAPFAVLRGRTRWRLLVKAPRGVNLQKVVRAWLAAVKTPRRVRIAVDVDPYSFL